MERPGFNEREKLLLAYFRDKHASNPRSALLYNLGLISAAVAFAAIGYTKDDTGWLYVAGLILIYEQARSAISGYRYSEVYRGIFSKYDAVVAEMMNGPHIPEEKPVSDDDRRQPLPG